MSENYPIDFVVTWVDGNDPVWQAEKAKYSPNKNADNRNVRFVIGIICNIGLEL